MTDNQKICAACKKIFDRKPGMSDIRWSQRTCCCRNCSNYVRRKSSENLKHPRLAHKRRIDTEKGVQTTYAM